MSMSPLSLSPEDDKLQKSKSIDGCLLIVIFSEKKICKETKQAFSCLYAPRSCKNAHNHLEMMLIMCSTIHMSELKYIWNFVTALLI